MGRYVQEPPSTALILEMLREEAEIATVGRTRFAGTLAQRNALWREYRNYLRQALSNFEAALGVANRSACLLQYYAMLNFAKAELMHQRAPAIVNTWIGHGLSFNPTRARSVQGDVLTVRDGVFRMLYEQRTGVPIPIGTRLPVKRLFSYAPEFGTQIAAAGVGTTVAGGLLQLIARDDTHAWALLAAGVHPEFDASRATQALFGKHFEEVTPTGIDWRDIFGLSRRFMGTLRFFESVVKQPINGPSAASAASAMGAAEVAAQAIRPLLGRTSDLTWDAILVPSFHRTRLFPMPPDLARYALVYYASSLVRYRPAMFDAQVFPEQAYVFDALARECALPMLVDALSGVRGEEHFFYARDAFRV